jgi:CAAX protease family protein
VARIAAALLLLVMPLVAIGSDADYYDEIEQVIRDAIDDAAAEYETAAASDPGNVALALQSCELYDSFNAVSEMYIEQLDDAAARCFEALLQDYPGHPDVELASLNRMDPEQAITLAERLHDAWNVRIDPSQHARVHAFLFELMNYDDERRDEAYRHCISALRLDRATDCRNFAAEYLIDHDQPQQAIAILSSPLDSRTDSYYLIDKIAKLTRLGAIDDVRRLYALFDFDEFDDYRFVELAKSLTEAGLAHEANALLSRVSVDFWDKEGLLIAQYRAALALGNYDTALIHYNKLRDLGLHTDPLLRKRIELASHDLSLPWRWRDLVGLLPILGALLTMAFAALLLPALVHYRGLMRKDRALAPGMPSSAWSLRQAWYVLFVVILSALLPMYIFDYDVLAAEFSGDLYAVADWNQVDSPRLLIWDVLIAGVLLLPLALRGSGLRQFWTRDWSVWRCIGVGTVTAIGLKLAYSIPFALLSEPGSVAQAITTEEIIAALYQRQGIWVTVTMIVVLVPLVEELMFRGVLLQGFSRHISFGWANVLQGLVFASLHEDVLAYPMFFAFALLAGIFYRRSGGLLAGIVLHVVFNATAVAVIVQRIA